MSENVFGEWVYQQEFAESLYSRVGDSGFESNLIIDMPNRSVLVNVAMPGWPCADYRKRPGPDETHSLVGYSHSPETLYNYLFGRILKLCSHGYDLWQLHDGTNPIHELLVSAAKRPGGIEGVVLKQHRAWNGAAMFRTSDGPVAYPPRPSITLWIERIQMREGIDYDFSDKSGVPRLNSRLMFQQMIVPKAGIKGKRLALAVSPHETKYDVDGWYCNVCRNCGDWIEWRKGKYDTLRLTAHCPTCSTKGSSQSNSQQVQQHQP